MYWRISSVHSGQKFCASVWLALSWAPQSNCLTPMQKASKWRSWLQEAAAWYRRARLHLHLLLPVVNLIHCWQYLAALLIVEHICLPSRDVYDRALRTRLRLPVYCWIDQFGVQSRPFSWTVQNTSKLPIIAADKGIDKLFKDLRILRNHTLWEYSQGRDTWGPDFVSIHGNVEQISALQKMLHTTVDTKIYFLSNVLAWSEH